MRSTTACLLASGLLALASPAAAQRGDVERKAFEDAPAGYRLKPPKGWDVVPVAPDERQLGLAFQADSPNYSEPETGHFRVVLVKEEAELQAWSTRLLQLALRDANYEFKERKPTLDESVEIAGLPARHRRWLLQGVHLDSWLIERTPERVGVLATVAEKDQFAKSWLVTFERAAKSLETFKPKALARGAGTTYAEKLASARVEAERTKGWHVVPTPSEKFILTTSSDNKKFVDEVIDRLERSRLVFEDDYPPPADFNHVSIVRLCASAEEFHRYGKTGGGVMGWFNPESTELVLFDAKDVDRNMSYAVMTHEAFHQYCHFLFGRSEAHRWFDEGHGDYYGGMKFPENGKPKVTAHMPGGLDRQPIIREMVQLGTHARLREHLNFDHAQWQNQGGGGVQGYCQSWSIIYMLRQGMLGKVNSKVWRKEYAEILPSYIRALRTGFEQAYAEEREKRLEESSAEGKTTSEVIELDSKDLGEKVVERIWKDAIAASWGKVDLDQFEENWVLYVKKYLDD